MPVAFWFFSLGGGLILFAYALYRGDPVFIVGQGMRTFIYMRNLMLIAKEEIAGRPAIAFSGQAPNLAVCSTCSGELLHDPIASGYPRPRRHQHRRACGRSLDAHELPARSGAQRASRAELEGRIRKACTITQARLQSASESAMSSACGCYASRTLASFDAAELQAYRTTGVFNDTARGKALAAIDACRLQRPAWGPITFGTSIRRRRRPDDASAVPACGEDDPVACKARRAAADQAERLRVDDVLLDHHPAGEALRRVARHDLNGCLRHDGPGVELRHHEMHRAAMDEYALRKSPLVGMGAAEGRGGRDGC